MKMHISALKYICEHTCKHRNPSFVGNHFFFQLAPFEENECTQGMFRNCEDNGCHKYSFHNAVSDTARHIILQVR